MGHPNLGSEGLVILRRDPRAPFADGNLVLYVEGKEGVRVLFSTEEIGQLLAFHQVGDDLATIIYTHPDFDSRRLSAVRTTRISAGRSSISFATM